MIDLGSWMNKILIGWGVDPKIANTFDETIIAILMIFIAVGLDYLCQAIFVGGMKRLARKTSYKWDTLMVKHKVIHHLIHIHAVGTRHNHQTGRVLVVRFIAQIVNHRQLFVAHLRSNLLQYART